MRASGTKGRPLPLFLWLTLATFALDQATKLAAVRLLRPGAPVAVLGSWLRLNLTHNPGAAFGLLPANWMLLALGSLVCLTVVLCVALAGGLVRHPERALALGLILGGALGNLYDRLRTKGVIDFIDLRVWPVFNVADIAITAGVGLLLLRMARGR